MWGSAQRRSLGVPEEPVMNISIVFAPQCFSRIPSQAKFFIYFFLYLMWTYDLRYRVTGTIVQSAIRTNIGFLAMPSYLSFTRPYGLMRGGAILETCLTLFAESFTWCPCQKSKYPPPPPPFCSEVSDFFLLDCIVGGSYSSLLVREMWYLFSICHCWLPTWE